MSKETIAVDMDDVLAMHAAAFVQFSNQKYGTSLQPEEYDENWFNLWGDLGWDEIERRASEFHIPETTLAYGRIDEAEVVLNRLKRDYHLAIVTARPKRIIPSTHEWLEKHHADVFSGVHFVPIWEPDNTVTKADICRQIGANYLIDDSVKHCNIAIEAGITSLLFGVYRWNRNSVDPRVIQVPNWSAVEDYFYGER